MGAPDYFDLLEWYTPPELVNEPVVIVYAADHDGVYRRVLDHAARTVTVYCAPWPDVHCDWCPWRAEPTVREWSSVEGCQ